MLAQVARRRSSWLRSLATARRLSRPLQLQATARPREDEEAEAEGGVKVKRPLERPRATRPGPQSLSFHLQLHAELSPLSGGPTREAAAAPKGRATEQQVTLRADADAGEFPALIARGSPAEKDVLRARESLQKLARDLADPRAAVARESGFQRARRQLKAATGKLDRMLYAMRQRRDFAQVEAVAFVWEEEFPHFAGQKKHWSVISEHYALALNYQQRFQEVVDKFSSCFREQEDHKRTAEAVSLLTPRLTQSIFVALGHLRDASGALQLLDTMRRHGVHVTKICEEMVSALPGETVPLSLLPMVMMTAAACGESERAMKFYSHPPDMPMSSFTEFRFEVCLQQLNHLGEDRTDLVDDLFVFALDSGMPIKYAALEQHIPLGIAVTEIGMAANLRLHRFDEVVMLFEDFSALDGERRRVLKRRFMLKTVLDAYKRLGRGDEALAIQALLKQTHGSLLDRSEFSDGEEANEEVVALGENAEEVTDEERDHDSNSDEVGEKERLSLERFSR
ncbi:uncharacterized protein IUM83_07311 [Phytophthora cinnamomi]|uniref:uncharacterized protein n=1 Tax=Phytophthora cinnamomi TaxID=4785 RepID=UPI00355AAC61|nr:hypothetical protein IUM83_07311 [Phytophthora cinnamomi]